MGVQYIDLGYNATGTVQTIRVGKDISLFAQGGEPPVPTRDIHATYAFVANTPTKVYDEFGATGENTYTIDDGTQTYTGSTLEFETDGAHTLHFISIDHHTWKRMFAGCTELTSLVLDSNVTGVSFYTCRNCSALTDVSMQGVQTIDNASFQACTALTEVNFEAVKEFGAAAFRGCVGLTSIHIPEGCTTTRSRTFSDCTGVTSLYIPSTLRFLSSTSESFENLTSLTSLTVNKITAPTTGYFTGAPTGTLYVPEGATGYDAWLAVLGEGWTLDYITP